MLFEVPRYNLKDDRSLSVANTPSLSKEHNNKDKAASSTDNNKDINQSPDHLMLNNKSIVEATNNNKRATKDIDNSSNVNSTLKKSVSFQVVPKHEPINVDTLGLRRSLMLVNNNKKLTPT